MIGVMCYWEYDQNFRDSLKLMESFPTDADGQPTVKTSTSRGNRDRLAADWLYWMYKPIDGSLVSADALKPIMGRAITVWSIESGVKLLRLHPPEWSKWLSTSFYDRLCKMPDWANLLNNGYILDIGTARAAEKIIYDNLRV